MHEQPHIPSNIHKSMQLFQTYTTDPYTPTLAVALLMVARLGRQPSCPIAKEQRKKTWSTHTMGLWKPSNRRKLDHWWANGCKWSGQPQKDRYGMLSLMCGSQSFYRCSHTCTDDMEANWLGNKQGQGGRREVRETLKRLCGVLQVPCPLHGHPTRLRSGYNQK